MSEISFAAQPRKRGTQGTTVTARHARMLKNASGFTGPNTFEHSAAVKVGQALGTFDQISTERRFQIQDEAESMTDIRNLNPGMLAGAFVFYQMTGNKFSADLFRKYVPGIVKTLVDARALTPPKATVVATVEEYEFDMLRYLLRVGAERNVELDKF